MRSKYIKAAIDKLGPWHQKYEMEHQWTTDKTISGEDVWSDIRELMNEDLTGAKILDIGANAAYYSMMLGMEGAIVTAVEPNKRFFSQARWTQYFFEDKYQKKFPVNIINESATDINLKNMGPFDYILALNVLHFLGKRQSLYISKMCKYTDKIIIRTRNNKANNSVGYYNGEFLKHEFFMLKKILGIMPIMLYGRLIKEEPEYNW